MPKLVSPQELDRLAELIYSDADVMALISRGEKRIAIRLYHELHGGDLKGAREAVEGLRRDARSHTPAT